jgi:hypothetical protein
MKEPNLMLRLPRELRDEIYTHLFKPTSSPATIICRQSGWTSAADPYTEKSQTLGHTRYRLTNATEAVEIRAAGAAGCQTWPARDGSSSVISSMLETAILRVNKQHGDEAQQSLLFTIFKSTVLFAPPAGTRIAKSRSWKRILHEATDLELIPFSWPQLQQCIPLLATNIRLKHLAINFKRMMKSVSPSSYPTIPNIKTMLSQVSTISSKGIKITWYADLDGHILNTTEQETCRQAIKITKELMTGGGTALERMWLGEYDEWKGGLTSWDCFCERVDVSPKDIAVDEEKREGNSENECVKSRY